MVPVIVLSIIQEKVNNPSPDDPFEPDIAAVGYLLYPAIPFYQRALSKLVAEE